MSVNRRDRGRGLQWRRWIGTRATHIRRSCARGRSVCWLMRVWGSRLSTAALTMLVTVALSSCGSEGVKATVPSSSAAPASAHEGTQSPNLASYQCERFLEEIAPGGRLFASGPATRGQIVSLLTSRNYDISTTFLHDMPDHTELYLCSYALAADPAPLASCSGVLVEMLDVHDYLVTSHGQHLELPWSSDSDDACVQRDDP